MWETPARITCGAVEDSLTRPKPQHQGSSGPQRSARESDAALLHQPQGS